MVFERRFTCCTHSISIYASRFVRSTFSIMIRVIIADTLSTNNAILVIINTVLIFDDAIVLEESEFFFTLNTFSSLIGLTVRVYSHTNSLV